MHSRATADVIKPGKIWTDVRGSTGSAVGVQSRWSHGLQTNAEGRGVCVPEQGLRINFVITHAARVATPPKVEKGIVHADAHLNAAVVRTWKCFAVWVDQVIIGVKTERALRDGGGHGKQTQRRRPRHPGEVAGLRLPSNRNIGR